MKNKLISSVMLAGTVLGMGGGLLTSGVTAFAADEPANANSNVTANIQSGGLDLEIGGNHTGVGANDAFLGDLTIGQDIANVTVTDLTKVTDHTDADGWTLDVKADNYDTTKDTLNVKLAVGEHAQVDLTGTAAKVSEGISQRDQIVEDGTFSATWGNTPKQGAYQSNLTWTLAPVVTPAG